MLASKIAYILLVDGGGQTLGTKRYRETSMNALLAAIKFSVLWNVSGWELVWLIIGLAGQLLFTARFAIQWIVSEREKRSVIPVAFWYLSLAGSLVLLSYAIYKKDPVFILGFCFNSVVYIRNLRLIYRQKAEVAEK